MNALIGSTGFVGTTIARSIDFSANFNSKNIESIAGQVFETIYCAGAPAPKWIANKDPAADKANLNRLTEALLKAKAKKVVLISTVDVYPDSLGVDEDSEINPVGHHAYGLHRLQLEECLRDHFNTTILRLPALFGLGLKKNAVYDLINQNNIAAIDPRGSFQFYNMARLVDHIQLMVESNIPLVNLVTEPITMAEIADRCFNLKLPGEFSGPAPRYDARSKFAESLGGTASGYFATKEQVFADLDVFVSSEAARLSSVVPLQNAQLTAPLIN